MRKRRRMCYGWLKFIGVIMLAVLVSVMVIYFRVRPLLYVVARSQAETIMLNAASRAMLNVLQEDGITYDSISRITRGENGEILGIEIDIRQINTLKNRIASEIPRKIAENEFYEVAVPLGTLVGAELTSGVGPKLHFPMQLTSTVVVDYKSNFLSEGINQTLHQILIIIDLRCNIVMLGFSEGFSVATTEVAAQTVIVGEVPDSFTNVIETPTDDIADEIFNFAEVS